MSNADSEQKTAMQLQWRLHTVMSDRGIRTATELYRRLAPYGIDITSHQLSRIVSKMPSRLNTHVLAALMTELKCDASELIRPMPDGAAPLQGPTNPVAGASRAPASAAPAPRAPRMRSIDRKPPPSVLGPKLLSVKPPPSSTD
jgi:DNA-binding Xre family transcriptional regulator